MVNFSKRTILALLFGLAPITCDAFSIFARPTAASLSSVTAPTLATRLYADANGAPEEGAEAEAAQAPESKSKDSSDILNSPAFLKRKMEVLESDIAKVDAEIEAEKERLEAGKQEWGDQLEKLQAEYQNIQSRMSEVDKESSTEATIAVAREMISILDNFDRAFGAVKAETEHEMSIEAEYRQVYQSILDTFVKLDIKEVPTVGSEFDYELHQAVMQRPSEDYEEGFVCDEMQKGYIVGETLIRPAMVVVAV